MKKIRILFVLVILMIQFGGEHRAAAQWSERTTVGPSASVGTGITYQGYLEDADGPVNDTCDFQFALFGSSDGSDQVGSTQTKSGVSVSEGTFTVSDLDFGDGIFTGAALYMEIAVRCPSGSGGYSSLDPRQLVTPAPYALSLPGLYTIHTDEGPNIIGGYVDNAVKDGAFGGTIGGGGVSWGPNYVFDHVGTVGGGANNQAGSDDGDFWNADGATVAGGWNNVASAPIASVGGGESNLASAYAATVGGGSTNHATQTNATVGGGTGNIASGGDATIGGGGGNLVSGTSGTVAGGVENTASGDYNPTVGGGYGNTVSETDSTIGGGHGNTVDGWAATISGGFTNTITSTGGTGVIGGGFDNYVSGDAATIGGGRYNTAGGMGATVPGGEGNLAGGDYSFAAGQNAQALHGGTFVWSDATGAFSSTASNQFAVQATGGVNFDTGGAPFLINGGSPGPYANVIVVAKSGGDFTSIQAALNSIGDAGENNPYLVWVAPGVYTETVTMEAWVDIEGAGEGVTKITYTGSSSPFTGTVTGADNAELRFLAVENAGGNTYATAIYNDSASPWLTHVTADASGASDSNYGVQNYSSSSPTMVNVTAIASGASDHNYGVHNYSSSSPMMTNVSASASGGDYNDGVSNWDSSPIMTNVTATASGGDYNNGVGNYGASPIMTNVAATAWGGSIDNCGVFNDGSSPTMRNVTAGASGGSSLDTGVSNWDSSPTIENSTISGDDYGIYNGARSGSYTVTVNNSKLSGEYSTIRNYSEFTTLVGASQLDGGAVNLNSGTVTCAGVYDENYTFYASTCP